MSKETLELYHHWSHFNFTSEQWREAAERFLLLVDAIRKDCKADEFVDHAALAQNWERCEICEHLDRLADYQEDFAKEFAAIWAAKVINGMQEN